MKKIAVVFLVIGFVALCSSCQKVPQYQIDAANAAIDSAKVVEAAVYVPEQLAQVEDSLKSALAEVETQKSNFFSDYENATKTLVYVAETAKQIGINAQARKAQLKEESIAVIAEVTALVAENKELIKRAPKGNEGKAALDSSSLEIILLESNIAGCQSNFDDGNYLITISKIKVARDKALSVQYQLVHNIKNGNTASGYQDTVPDNLDIPKDTTMRKAQLGFSYYKIIPMEATRDFRVNVVVKGTRSAVKSNIRNDEKKELEFAEYCDTSIVCYIDDIDVYNKIKVSLDADVNDFEITPFDPSLKEEQELDFINGNNWHWKVRAVSKTARKATVVLRIEVMPIGKYRPTSNVVNIDIAISNPVIWIERIFNWFFEKFDLIITSVIGILGVAIGTWLVNRKKK